MAIPLTPLRSINDSPKDGGMDYGDTLESMDTRWDGFQYLDAQAFSDEEPSTASVSTWAFPQPFPHADVGLATPQSYKLRRAIRRNHGDTFFGAKEARASPVVPLSCQAKASGSGSRPTSAPASPSPQPRPEPKAAKPQARKDTDMNHVSSPPRTRPDLPTKPIARILFPETPQPQPRPPSTSWRTAAEPRSSGYVSCCVGCYGSGLACDKKGQETCTGCVREGTVPCSWITMAERKRRDR